VATNGRTVTVFGGTGLLLTRNQVDLMQIDTVVIAGDAWIC